MLLWNCTAAISILKIRRVTHISIPSSVRWQKLKNYNFPISYLAHIIHWYHKCIQRKELVLICSSIRFIEHESAFVWLQKALEIIAPILLLATFFCGHAPCAVNSVQ